MENFVSRISLIRCTAGIARVCHIAEILESGFDSAVVAYVFSVDLGYFIIKEVVHEFACQFHVFAVLSHDHCIAPFVSTFIRHEILHIIVFIDYISCIARVDDSHGFVT